MSDELWRDLIIVTVWSTALGSLIQAAVHIVTFGVLRYQKDRTDFGRYIKRRELSLGTKNIFRSIYELLIAITITWQVGFGPNPQTVAILVAVTVTTWVAVFYGARFVNALIRESGMEIVLERTNIRQDVREEEQNVREVHQDERSDRLDERDALGNG